MTNVKPSLQFAVGVFLGAILLGSCYCPSAQAADEHGIAQLKAIQQSIREVVATNLGACVAISDGVGFGSGVIVSADGLVLTAGHVITSSDRGQYEIILPSGRRVKAKALGKNLDADAGMVQIIDKGPWPFVKMDQTNGLKPGDWVVSLGHSGGFELGRDPPVRSGRILERDGTQIVTDAVLIGGDSGGPLFNLDGELIAIHSSIGDSVAENRHVTLDLFRSDWDRLRQGEKWGELPELNEPDQKSRRGLIGAKMNLTTPNAVIKSVDPGMPAHDTGILPGDIVIEFDEIAITNGRHLIDVIKKYHAGDVCPLVIVRNGTKIRFEIMLR